MVLVVESATSSGAWAWRQSARCSTSATSRSMSGSPRTMGSAIRRRPVSVVRAYLMPHRWTPHPETGSVGVVTVPENVRHRPVLRSRARECWVGWFTGGENFPTRATQPDGARSVLPRSDSQRRGPTDGSLCRCAPRPTQDPVAVASTDTPGGGACRADQPWMSGSPSDLRGSRTSSVAGNGCPHHKQPVRSSAVCRVRWRYWLR